MSARRGILIVDDEPVLLMAIRQELKLALGTGFAYETALNAELGLDALGEFMAKGIEIGLIISDWLMPGMRGDEFLRLVRAAHPTAKLVMISGHAEDQQMRSLAGELGLFAYMSKPYRRNELARVAKDALGGKAAT